MLDWIKRFFKKLLSLLKKIWPVLLLVGLAIFLINPALFATILTTIGSWGAAVWGFLGEAMTSFIGMFEGLTFWEGLAAAIGVSMLLDPEGTGKALGSIVDSVGGAVADVATAVTDSVFSSPTALLLGGGLLLWWVMSNNDSSEDEDDRRVKRSTNRVSDGAALARAPEAEFARVSYTSENPVMGVRV